MVGVKVFVQGVWSALERFEVGDFVVCSISAFQEG